MDVITDVLSNINTNFDLFVFIIVGIIVLVSALLMLESKDLSHSIIFLALTFAGIGVIYLDLNAEFIAMIQMTVYTGGVIVLFLFALMLTRNEEFNLRGDLHRGVSVLIALLLISIFTFIVYPIANLWVNGITPLNEIIAVNACTICSGYPFGIGWIGFALFNYYQIGFLILGFIVIAALIGTIYLVKNEKGEDVRVISPAASKEDKSV